VDLNSHHGTHLLRRGDVFPRTIVPDVPIPLQDGDTLTFGKAVGKEPYCVSPITANVMLIYDTEAVLSPPVSQPVISLLDSPTTPTTPIKTKQPPAAPNSSLSGRYGLFGPPSPSSQSSPASLSSEEEEFSQSDPDIEEEDDDEDDYLDPPEEYPSTSFGGHAQAQSASACYGSLPSLHGLGLLASRHVIHHAPHTPISTHAPHTHLTMNMNSQMAQPLNVEHRSTFDRWFSAQSPRAAPQDPCNINLQPGTDGPMDIPRPISPPVANLLQDVPADVIEEALASVSQTDAQINANHGETPVIIGAYPGSPYPGSPVRSAAVSPWVGSEDVEEEPQHGLVPQPPQLPVGLANPSLAAKGTAPSSVVAEASESSEQLAEDVASDIDADGEADLEASSTVANVGTSSTLGSGALVASAGVPTINTRDPAGVGASANQAISIDARLTSLDEALVNLWVCLIHFYYYYHQISRLAQPLPPSPLVKQGNVLRMQIAHRKTQSDHKMLSNRTDALAARVDAVQADLHGVMHGDDQVESLTTRVQAAEDLLVVLRGRLSAAEEALAGAKAKQAEALARLEELGVAAEATEAVVMDEVSGHTHAPSAPCAHTAQSEVAPTTTTPMRKRKRIEEDDGNFEREEGQGQEEQGETARAHRPDVQARKRARRCARAAVHTSAAIIVGAVAAWSALAFV
jgi:hypothetical protein